MNTLKDGDWDDISVWSENRPPKCGDPIKIDHFITLQRLVGDGVYIEKGTYVVGDREITKQL